MDVDAPAVGRFVQRSGCAQVYGLRVVDEQHQMRVARGRAWFGPGVTTRGLRRCRDRRGRVRARSRRPGQVGRHPSRRWLMTVAGSFASVPGRTWTARTPASVAMRSSTSSTPRRRASAWARHRMPLPLISACDPSALNRVITRSIRSGVRIGPAAVGAEDQAVGTDTAAPVAPTARVHRHRLHAARRMSRVGRGSRCRGRDAW